MISTNARREPMPYGSCAILLIQCLWSRITSFGVEMLSKAFARSAEAVASRLPSLRLSAFFARLKFVLPKCNLPERKHHSACHVETCAYVEGPFPI